MEIKEFLEQLDKVKEAVDKGQSYYMFLCLESDKRVMSITTHKGFNYTTMIAQLEIEKIKVINEFLSTMNRREENLTK